MAFRFVSSWIMLFEYSSWFALIWSILEEVKFQHHLTSVSLTEEQWGLEMVLWNSFIFENWPKEQKYERKITKPSLIIVPFIGSKDSKLFKASLSSRTHSVSKGFRIEKTRTMDKCPDRPKSGLISTTLQTRREFSLTTNFPIFFSEIDLLVLNTSSNSNRKAKMSRVTAHRSKLFP